MKNLLLATLIAFAPNLSLAADHYVAINTPQTKVQVQAPASPVAPIVTQTGLQTYKIKVQVPTYRVVQEMVEREVDVAVPQFAVQAPAIDPCAVVQRYVAPAVQQYSLEPYRATVPDSNLGADIRIEPKVVTTADGVATVVKGGILDRLRTNRAVRAAEKNFR